MSNKLVMGAGWSLFGGWQSSELVDGEVPSLVRKATGWRLLYDIMLYVGLERRTKRSVDTLQRTRWRYKCNQTAVARMTLATALLGGASEAAGWGMQLPPAAQARRHRGWRTRAERRPVCARA